MFVRQCGCVAVWLCAWLLVCMCCVVAASLCRLCFLSAGLFAGCVVIWACGRVFVLLCACVDVLTGACVVMLLCCCVLVCVYRSVVLYFAVSFGACMPLSLCGRAVVWLCSCVVVCLCVLVLMFGSVVGWLWLRCGCAWEFDAVVLCCVPKSLCGFCVCLLVCLSGRMVMCMCGCVLVCRCSCLVT